MSGRVGMQVRPRVEWGGEFLPRLNCLEACALAAELVKKANFALVYRSMKSEACYYAAPGRHGVLRIASHSKRSRNEMMKDGPTIVSLTFPEANLKGWTKWHVENHAANGIGIYMIRAEHK